MENLIAFYKKRITEYTSELTRVKKLLLASSMLRLIIFLAALTGIYFSLGNTKLILGIILGAIVIFVFLVSRHADLVNTREKILALIKINDTEIKVLDRDYKELPMGSQFADPLHHFSQDIDLFGKGSFFQYTNRTTLEQGTEKLAQLFTENRIDGIEEKQKGIKELTQMAEWRQQFAAEATLVKTEISAKTITGWLNSYTFFVPKVMKYVPLIFSVLSILVGALYFMDIVSGYMLGFWFFTGLGITGSYLGKINTLSAQTGKVQTVFQQYQKLISQIEKTEFTSELLRNKKAMVVRKDRKTSLVLKDFARLLGALDQRNNMFFGVVGNGFLLWDLNQAFKIEQWIKTYGQEVGMWFETIAFFDAYNSLGNFAFNHPKYSFPKLTDDAVVLKTTDATHPLLDPQKSVTNDFEIQGEQFLIITGANMAGKSTFLRTVSLQIVMSNMGLPVCASAASYSPIKLITSMRTSDSLTDDESYFFSELKRLKFIVDQIKTDRYFIVLDEILKGTNSTDKAIGSRKFVEKLIGSKATGIIATHDLSLCEASNTLPQVENHYFDAEILDGELYFDYKFKEGICQNMNASFLLKKMQIVD
ncbi:DNA mismatch repair protein MutS [Flavobacteriaceae bacterium KMM 6897]|nr:DNA mismatch repair protein MutS [Flavobacteriaceae bacterium KMM 6897]